MCQLLVFRDASMACYATTVYLRIVTGTNVQTNLVFSKIRLVPTGKGKSKKVKKLTIPRLELLAVVIGTRAANFVATELRMTISEKIIWTDSQCVLHWLKTTKPLSVFVENRLKEIKLNQEYKFRFIVSSDNPADMATRGLPGKELEQCALWWHGPPWLKENQLTWPVWNLPEITPDSLEETRKPAPYIQVNSVTGIDTSDKVLFGLSKPKWSSLRKLLRISVYVLRFIKIKVWNKLQEETKQKYQKLSLLFPLFTALSCAGAITRLEIKMSTLLHVYFIQHCRFKEVFIAARNKKHHCLQKQLGIQLDEYGILRCYGRYANASIEEEARLPKLLPRNNYFTQLLVLEVHGRLAHAGIAHTLNQIRQEYWILQGRSEVRHILHQCVVCKRHQGPPFCLPAMPPWPKERVSVSEPFKYVGLDYLGPLYVKEGNVSQKMWICLFTCMAVRAVHLEMVKGLSAELFLDCLRRFIARRGKPTLIITDNAPQFHLVRSAIDQQWLTVYRNDEVLNFFSYEGIEWKFTTALSPWQGGFYERLVGVVKKALRKGINRSVLYWDKLMTVLTEVEAIVNTRPLTYVYEELKSSFVLTPSHFLIGSFNSAIPFAIGDAPDDTEFTPTVDSAQTLLQYWRKNQKQLQAFWEEWVKGYLMTLRETLPLRHKSPRVQVHRRPEIGEIVIVHDSNLPRRMWKLAKVTELIRGRDSQIRAARVKLPNRNVIERSINQLYPLELKSMIDTNQELTDNNEDSFDDNIKTSTIRPMKRAAAIEARRKMSEQLHNEVAGVFFSLGSVMN